jgi:hypothetical protein
MLAIVNCGYINIDQERDYCFGEDSSICGIHFTFTNLHKLDLSH